MEAPSVLIDPIVGVVHLRMVPFHLDRLHGPHPKGAKEGPDGLPFPFLEGAEPFDVVFRGGMTPIEVEPKGLMEPNSSLGSTSWWRLHAYAITPFGWVPFPTPFFNRDRLSSLTLTPRGSSPAESCAAMGRWLRHELGEPLEVAPAGKAGFFRKFRWVFACRLEMSWKFDWGKVYLGYEPRDGDALMSVQWDDPC